MANRLTVAKASSRVAPHVRMDDGPLDPRALLTSLGEVVYDWDLQSDRLTWGLNARDVLGAALVRRIGTGKGFAALVEPGSGLDREDVILGGGERDAGTGVPYHTRYVLQLGAQKLALVEDAGRWFAGDDGRPVAAHGVVHVERLSRSDTASFVALSSGAARSRAGLLAAIDAELETGAAFALIVVAVQDLGRLNETLGYEAADAILEQSFSRIAGAMRRRDRVMRYSSNRFAALLMSCSPEQLGPAVTRLALAVETEPIDTGLGAVGVRLRTGAALAPQHADTAESLLRHAEEALAEAKRLGRASVVYDPSQVQDAARRRAATTSLDLVEALNDRRLVLARQPVVEALSRRPAFCEALMRLRRPDGTLANAGQVIPAAERLGLVGLIDHRVLELAVDALAAEPQQRMAINVSPATLRRPDWLAALASHLGARRGVAERLIVEVTETAAVEDAQAMRAALDAMKALGVAIAIDDFGSGHTSFKLLRSLPVDILKIDGAFVQNLSRSTDDRFFVRTLIDLAQHLGIDIVAEWVENEETAQMLTNWGVAYLQGDHIAPATTSVAPARHSLIL